MWQWPAWLFWPIRQLAEISFKKNRLTAIKGGLIHQQVQNAADGPGQADIALIYGKYHAFAVIIGHRLMLAPLFLDSDIAWPVIAGFICKTALQDKGHFRAGMGVRGDGCTRGNAIEFCPSLIIVKDNITFK